MATDDLDPSLVLALVQVESGFRKYAISSSGARGYMQVMPFWVRQIGDGDAARLFHLQTNLRFGCVLLRHFLNEASNDLSHALVRYFIQSPSGEVILANRAGQDFAKSVLTAIPKWTSKFQESKSIHLNFAGQEYRDCEFCPNMITIPAGSFEMGSTERTEQPLHRVNVAAFLISRTEVTQKQWAEIMGKNSSKLNKCGPDCPVVNVSWNDAQEFARKLSQKTGKPYRLPTEAEWEYAARAGSKGQWSFGDDEPKLGEYGWFNSNSGSTTHAVAERQPNAFGLYDMHGNAWEWVQDVWHENYQGAPSDGSAWLSGGDQARRVLRGGGWNNDPGSLRSAYRGLGVPDNRGGGMGMRIARTL